MGRSGFSWKFASFLYKAARFLRIHSGRVAERERVEKKERSVLICGNFFMDFYLCRSRMTGYL